MNDDTIQKTKEIMSTLEGLIHNGKEYPSDENRAQRNNQHLIENLIRRKDIFLVRDVDQLNKALAHKLSAVDHTYRKHIPFLPPYREDPNNLDHMSQGQLIRAYLFVDALESREFISEIGNYLDDDLKDLFNESGGLIIFDNDAKLTLNRIESAYSKEKNSKYNTSYLIPEGTADRPHVARYHMHATSIDNRDDAGPSGGTLFLATGDIGNCHNRTKRYGEDHNIVITKLDGPRFNIDFYSGEMRNRNPAITVLDLGNYGY